MRAGWPTGSAPRSVPASGSAASGGTIRTSCVTVRGSHSSKREGYTFDSERRLVAPALTRIHVPERRENAARPRERRVRRSRSTASRGEPDPEPEPPLRVIPLAAFRRELRRALGVSP
jgi:hypothetical protein